MAIPPEKLDRQDRSAAFDPSKIFDPLLTLQLQLEKEGYANPLVRWEQHVKQREAQYGQMSIQYFDRLQRATQLIVKHFNVSDLNEIDSKNDRESTQDQQMLEALPSQDSPSDDDKSDEELIKTSLQMIYDFGSALYEEGKFSEAADVLFFLVILSPLEYNALVMLGMSEQMQQNYETAVRCYFQATLMNRDFPYPFLYLAQCFYHLQDTATTRYYLDIVLQNSEWKQDFSEEYQSAIALAALQDK